MKLHIKKLYKDTVHQLEKHQTEIEIALAVAAMAGVAREDEDFVMANALIAEIYQKLLNDFESAINEINSAMEDDNGTKEEQKR